MMLTELIQEALQAPRNERPARTKALMTEVCCRYGACSDEAARLFHIHVICLWDAQATWQLHLFLEEQQLLWRNVPARAREAAFCDALDMLLLCTPDQTQEYRDALARALAATAGDGLKNSDIHFSLLKLAGEHYRDHAVALEDYSTAKALFCRCQAGVCNVSNDELYWISEMDLARTQLYMDDAAGALLRAHQLYRDVGGRRALERDASLPDMYGLLADCLLRKDRLHMAYPFAYHAMVRNERSLGAGHFDTLRGQFLFGVLQYICGEAADGFQRFCSTFETNTCYLFQSFLIPDSARRAQYAMAKNRAFYVPFLRLAHDYCERSASADAVERFYDAVSTYKTLVMDGELLRGSLDRDPYWGALLTRLQREADDLSPGDTRVAVHQQIAALYEQARFRDYMLRVTCNAIRRALPPDTMLLDFYDSEEGGAGRAYLIFAITHFWVVPDLSAAVLMLRFYDLYRRGESEAHALIRVKRMLRTMTAREFAADLCPAFLRIFTENEMLDAYRALRDLIQWMPPAAQPFSHPRHWAGFVLHS